MAHVLSWSICLAEHIYSIHCTAGTWCNRYSDIPTVSRTVSSKLLPSQDSSSTHSTTYTHTGAKQLLIFPFELRETRGDLSNTG